MLPRSKRLKTKAFKEIIEKGRSFHCPFLIIRLVPSQGISRFSVSVSKKISKNAVDRNKMRRRIYSIISKINNIKDGYHLIIIPKTEARDLSFDELSVEINKLFVKTGLLK